MAATVAWALASCILFLFGSFTAASFDPLDWAPPGRCIIALLSLAAGAACGTWAFKKIDDYHNLIRIHTAGLEASAQWNRKWVLRSQVAQPTDAAPGVGDG